jgi:hypothetical protein
MQTAGCKQPEKGGSMVMKKTKRVLVTMLALVLAIGLSAAICAAQQPSVTGKSAPAKPEAKDRLMIKGKIGQMGSAQYYVQGENPPGEYLIVNPNAKQLQGLKKRGKTVRVEGYTTVSADRIFIEKIDGKSYRGDGKANAQ